ncbi:MAG: 16S rRNA (guanine(527)-N(7))-methyltransferase RsmG [Geminicoccaceae bacterium]
MTPEEFAARLDVSRETLSRVEAYLALLERWQKAINLVGRGTLADPWRRHILDSAQLLPHLPSEPADLYDLGSGAGLPGLVLAIMGRSGVHLVESDRRKVQFLREACRILDLPVEVHADRIESLPDGSADVVTSRALAPLPRLIGLAAPLLRPNAVCLFLKGRSQSDELTQARKCWRIKTQSIPSLTDPSGSLLKLWDIGRAPLHRQ